MSLERKEEKDESVPVGHVIKLFIITAFAIVMVVIMGMNVIDTAKMHSPNTKKMSEFLIDKYHNELSDGEILFIKIDQNDNANKISVWVGPHIPGQKKLSSWDYDPGYQLPELKIIAKRDIISIAGKIDYKEGFDLQAERISKAVGFGIKKNKELASLQNK